MGGREFIGLEQPLGVGAGIYMEGRRGRVSLFSHTAHPQLSSWTTRAGPQTKQGDGLQHQQSSFLSSKTLVSKKIVNEKPPYHVSR